VLCGYETVIAGAIPHTRAFGLFPAATMRSAVQLRAAIINSGLEIIDERVFGEHQQNPYIVARKPA
jgi:hypothetical protein